ncbi:MAG: apolipoprotein N-acyltransferase [Gammaproteobacteria bacterium]|nr:apolipoprotein N-acyltransferase [Gammaproteobacteria bacterium]
MFKPGTKQGVLLSTVAGAALVGAFAPFYLWPIAFISPAILFWCCHQARVTQTFLYGFVFGLGMFSAGVSWVYISLHTYGGMPLWMGGIAVFGFASLLAFFSGLVMALAAWLGKPGSAIRLLLFVPAWVMAEWLRSWMLTGFPWLELGYSQTPTWLFGLAPVGGVYLVSFAAVAVSAMLVLIAFYPAYRLRCAALLLIWLGAFWGVNKLGWTEPVGDQLGVGLVQANVSINEKWQPEFRTELIETLRGLSAGLAQQHEVDLLLWPETALPLFVKQTDTQFWRTVKPAGVALLTGLMEAPQAGQIYNAAALVCDDQPQVYRKRHLVPFGEYLPLRFLFGWVLDYLNLPMSDFSAGEGAQPLSCGERINIGLSICYEDAFASEYRYWVGDATVLVNISEDAWFGDSLAPHQRVQMAQMRARELGRPMLRAANSGPSVVIDELGHVLSSTGQFQAATLFDRVQPQTGDTLYKRWGNWLVWSCVLILAVAGFQKRRARNS